ncbi:MAG: ribosomal protein S18-alanine N-acetyltransferase [Acidobacteria bacterium]|nr:ribosomal protein S18-alanine N-acetyltransferase [Acidobacteriota bacterium]
MLIGETNNPTNLFQISFSIDYMKMEDLQEVVFIEEQSGLNRWGFDSYKRELFTNPDAVMLVARSPYLAGRGVLGFFAGWTVADEMHVNNIASHPDYRRMGIGRSLIEAAIHEGRMRGVSFVLLEVRASNDAAQALYKKIGFNFVNRRRDYYRLPTEDAFVMKLNLLGR